MTADTKHKHARSQYRISKVARLMTIWLLGQLSITVPASTGKNAKGLQSNQASASTTTMQFGGNEQAVDIACEDVSPLLAMVEHNVIGELIDAAPLEPSNRFRDFRHLDRPVAPAPLADVAESASALIAGTPSALRQAAAGMVAVCDWCQEAKL